MRAQDLPVITLEGAPHQQGLAYGAHVADGIARMHRLWWDELAQEGIAATAWQAGLVRRFEPFHRREVPAYMSFLEGIAQGSGLPFEAVFGLNLVDEDVVGRYLRSQAAASPSAPSPGPSPSPLSGSVGERCTVLAGRARDGWVGGQNQDLGGNVEGLQVLLHFMPSTGMERYVLTLAGLAALSGMNARGLATFQNQVRQLDSHVEGISVAALVHEVLQCADRVAALKRLNRWPHASGQAYTLLDTRGVTGVEASATGALAYPPSPAGHLAHTNHPLRPDGWRTNAPGTLGPGLRAVGPRTRARFERVSELADTAPLLEPEMLMRFFADRQHPVCPISLEHSPDADAIGYTIGSIVCHAGGAQGPRFWMASGPPSLEPFVAYPFAS